MDLALEDAHLVAKDGKFDVLLRVGAVARRRQRQEPAEAEVDEGEGHVDSDLRGERRSTSEP
jgi:hypothetical protein